VLFVAESLHFPHPFWRKKTEVPGLMMSKKHGVVVVAQRGILLHQEVFTAPDAPEPADPGGRYVLASLTKPLTASLVMRLLDEEPGESAREKSLHRPLATFGLEGEACWMSAVTVHHLLTHTSGLKDGRDDGPVHPPGETFLYSNRGYNILGTVIRKLAGGLPLSAIFRECLFRPARMPEALFVDTGTLAQIRAAPEGARVCPGFRRCGKGPEGTDGQLDLADLSVAGGVMASARDVIAWVQALWWGDLVSGGALKRMIQPRVPRSGSPEWDGGGLLYHGYGLDMRLARNVCTGGRGWLFQHCGGTKGFQGRLVVHPGSGLVVVNLSAFETGDPALFQHSEAVLAEYIGTGQSARP
jgi:CubicO group peptidase (beta-lactamase class C family)